MLIILPISFNHLSESYFLCHLIHMTFLKAKFRWCQAQNTHKSPVWPNSQNIYFFQKCGEEAEGRYYNNFSSSHSSIYMYDHPSGKKCLHGEKLYEEIWVNRLNDASSLYSISQISKCACSQSLWHLRWLQKSIPHLLVEIQWMYTIHNILNIIRIMLSNYVPLM